MNDITNIDVDVDDAVEPEVVEPNEEYEVRIVGVKFGMDKNDAPYMLPRFEIVDRPLAKEFTRFYRLPHEGLDAKQMNQTKWALKTFEQCFGVSLKGCTEEDLKGATGWAILGLQDDPEYGEQNTIKKLIAGK